MIRRAEQVLRRLEAGEARGAPAQLADDLPLFRAAIEQTVVEVVPSELETALRRHRPGQPECAPGAGSGLPAQGAARRRQAMITVEHVRHRYDRAESPALDDVSLDIAEASCFAVLGPNGAGKTTLLSLMTGALALQEGEIRVDGAVAESMILQRRSSGARALVPQDLALYPELTGRENLAFFAGIHELGSRAWRDSARSLRRGLPARGHPRQAGIHLFRRHETPPEPRHRPDQQPANPLSRRADRRRRRTVATDHRPMPYAPSRPAA